MTKILTRPWVLALLAALAVLALTTGCSIPDDKRGDPGIVKERDKDSATKHRSADYDLTIERKNGTTYDLDVTRGGFDHCYRGSKYPKCVDN